MSIVLLIVLSFFSAMVVLENATMERNINNILKLAHEVDIDAPQSPIGMLIFHVKLTVRGETEEVISPYPMSEDFAIEAAVKALEKKSPIGRIINDGQHLAYENIGNCIVFVFINSEVAMLESHLVSLLWIIPPLLMIIFFASVYSAKRSVAPIEISFGKQREFIADASHELKTPISTVLANTDVLLQSIDDHSKKWAVNIKEEAGRMASLVDGLLCLAKIDYPNQQTLAGTLDLGEVLNDVLLPLEAVIFEKNINLNAKCEQGIIVKGDRAQIHTLLGTLIDNAIKYSGGDINISIEKSGSYAHIIVQNSGEPIAPEKLDKLFDRFYRVDESREYTDSFGLGLAIAKAIAVRHNWKIKVSSDPQNGTRFVVKAAIL